MQIPQGFIYRRAFLHGRPKHTKFDDFYIRHPFMDHEKRAKIFAPFDALAGFNELILSKEVHYVEKMELDEDRENDLDRKTEILSSAVKNSRDAREKSIEISVTYYVPCTDVLHDAYGVRGQYVTEKGILWKVDTVFRRLKVNNTIIDFDDIYNIDGKIFSRMDENDEGVSCVQDFS